MIHFNEQMRCSQCELGSLHWTWSNALVDCSIRSVGKFELKSLGSNRIAAFGFLLFVISIQTYWREAIVERPLITRPIDRT